MTARALDRVQVNLLFGPGLPIPAGREMIESLQQATIREDADGPGGFELTFHIGRRSSLLDLLLSVGTGPVPLMRFVVTVTVGGSSAVLIDGLMTNHRLNSGGSGAGTTLTVMGKDLTAAMDFIEFTGLPYPALPAEGQVALILLKYAFLGIVPKIIPSPLADISLPIDKIPTHQGTDLAHINRLAEETGYVFYLEPGPVPGVSAAYWGPEIKLGPPQPALNVDMDAHTNVETISFSFDNERNRLPMIVIHPKETKIPIPIPVPDVTPLNPPLGALRPIPHGLQMIDSGTKYSPVRAALVALGKAARFSEVVSASGSLDVLRYGRVLRARKLVGVRGAGRQFDGLYYVRGVTHTLERGKFSQSFELSRNGLFSTIPNVPA